MKDSIPSEYNFLTVNGNYSQRLREFVLEYLFESLLSDQLRSFHHGPLDISLQNIHSFYKNLHQPRPYHVPWQQIVILIDPGLVQNECLILYCSPCRRHLEEHKVQCERCMSNDLKPFLLFMLFLELLKAASSHHAYDVNWETLSALILNDHSMHHFLKLKA